MFFLQAKTKDSQCIKHSGIRTLKNIVLLSRHIKLVVMPSNATLKAFQLDQGKSNNIFPVLLLQKKKKKKKKKNAGMTYRTTRWLAHRITPE